MTKYFPFKYDMSGLSDEDFNYVKLPFAEGGDKKKVLFVLDYVPAEDLDSGKLLSGVTGDLLQNMLTYCRGTFAPKAEWFSWCACAWAGCRTFGKSREFMSVATKEFNRRLNTLIAQYKPDYVVGFGSVVQDALIGDKVVTDDKGRRYSHWLGVPVERSLALKGGKTHNYKFVANLSLDRVVRGKFSEAFMLGYMSRCLIPLFRAPYHVDGDRLLAAKPYLIDTKSKFDKLLTALADADTPCIDTETDNLNRICNKLLIIQFAVNQDRGYIVPIHHKDTPFLPKELQYVKTGLKEYFESKTSNKYHIYANAKFDLMRIRHDLGVEYYENDVFDIFGGAFALDENMRFLQSFSGEWYYSLGNMAVQYGFEGYLEAKFGKADRANFAETDLYDPDVQKYCVYDTVVPLAIHNQQALIAKQLGYKKWLDVVVGDISDTSHAFTSLEHTGANLDVNYLFFLRSKESPIEKVITDLEQKLMSSEACKKADRLLSSSVGRPASTILGEAPAAILNLKKPEHKQKLFFDVLKLKPLALGKKGTGKVDKAFQQHYADVKEVKMFTEIEKAKKLRDAYVKSFIQLLGTSADFQSDHRIRATYHFLRVVTHRGAASNPNLQNIPTHSLLAKYIKRLFCARQGTLYAKVDYKAHEVRVWGLVSFDKGIAELFAAATKLLDAYRLNPTPELKARLKAEADIHYQNAHYFFGVAFSDIDKEMRSAVKAVVFGLIYQKSVKKLAEELGKPVEFMEALVKKFFGRFPNGMKWLDNAKITSKKNLYIEAPTGIRRNLWGYMIPDSHPDAREIHSKMGRQACNSPPQGCASKFMMNGIRLLSKTIVQLRKKMPDFRMYLTNSVHDSLEPEVGYEHFLKGLDVIEWALTKGVKGVAKKRHNFDLLSTPEVDFEIGATLSRCESWDFSAHQLERLVLKELMFQRNELAHPIVPDKVHDIIFAPIHEAPAWLQQQLKNTGYKFTLTEKAFIKETRDGGLAMIKEGEAITKTLDDLEGEDREKAEKKAKALLSDGHDAVETAEQWAAFYMRRKNKV